MKKPLQFNTSFNKTLYDDLLMKYQNFNFMNRANNMNTYINPLASNMIMPGNPNMNLNANNIFLDDDDDKPRKKKSCC